MIDRVILPLAMVTLLAGLVAYGLIQQYGHPVAILIVVAAAGMVALKILVAGQEEN